MVKSKAAAEAKMRENVRVAGRWLADAMEEADDPIDVILKDPDAYAKKLADGVVEAIRRGDYKVGLETAKKRNAWRASKDRASTHYEERADDMVKHAMEDYDERKKCIEAAKAAIAGMPKATRAQRIARSAKYQEEMGSCMDKVKGRK